MGGGLREIRPLLKNVISISKALWLQCFCLSCVYVCWKWVGSAWDGRRGEGGGGMCHGLWGCTWVKLSGSHYSESKMATFTSSVVLKRENSIQLKSVKVWSMRVTKWEEKKVWARSQKKRGFYAWWCHLWCSKGGCHGGCFYVVFYVLKFYTAYNEEMNECACVHMTWSMKHFMTVSYMFYFIVLFTQSGSRKAKKL